MIQITLVADGIDKSSKQWALTVLAGVCLLPQVPALGGLPQ
jgi:hypothetical protein